MSGDAVPQKLRDAALAGLFVRAHNAVGRAHRVARQIEAGAVGVNAWAPIDPRLPWGGFKQSGLGRECGLSGVLSYTEEKTTTVVLT